MKIFPFLFAYVKILFYLCYINNKPMYTSTTEFSKLIAKKLKLKIVKNLGGGGQGTAHLLKDGRVLKVTGQTTEYHTSTERIGQFHPNICQIFETYRVSFNGNECFAIIQELLDTSCKEALSEFEDNTDMERIARNLVNDGDDMDEKYVTMLTNLENDTWAQCNYSGYIEMYLMLVEASREIGIENSDLYSGNIGKRTKDNEWVLFDLGYCHNHNSSEGKQLSLDAKIAKSKRNRHNCNVFAKMIVTDGYKTHMTLGGMLKQKTT